MAKDKNKNRYGSFPVGNTGYRKYTRYFIATLIVVIFIYSGMLIFNKLTKKDSKAATAVADEIPGWWYQKYFNVTVCEQDNCKPDVDPDLDLLSNSHEYFYHTNPLVAFTVGDELNDGQLVAAGLDPSRPGKMTFDQAMSEDNILAESLLLDQDIKSIASEAKDISKVSVPLVDDSQLKIIEDYNEQSLINYFTELKKTLDKYFSPTELEQTPINIETGSSVEIENMNNKFLSLHENLKKISVPRRMVSYHKYIVSFYQLVPEVLSTEGLDMSSSESDLWFEKVQAVLVISQKLNFEQQQLQRAIASQ